MMSKEKLGKYLEFINGFAFSKASWATTGYKIIRIQNLTGDKAPYNHTENIPNSKYIIKKGDILFSWAATLGVYKWKNEDALLNQHIYKVVTKDKNITSEFSYYLLTNIINELTSKMKGSTMKHISKADLEDFEIVLPNLEVQNYIVFTLDKVQSIIEKRKKISELFRQLKVSLFLNMFGDTYYNPKGFEVKKLKNIIRKDTKITYGIIQAGPNIEHGIPYIKSGDIKDGKVTTRQLWKTTREIAERYKYSRCSAGDLIMSIRATVGSIALIPNELDGVNLTQGTARIAPDTTIVDRMFLYELIKSDGIQAKIEQKTKGATFKEITLAALREIEVPIPDLDLQIQFRKKYEVILQVKTKVDYNLIALEALFQSIFQKAFKGELIERNEVEKYLSDAVLQEELVGFVNSRDYILKEEYEKKQKLLFELLENRNSNIEQIYNLNKKGVDVKIKTN